MMTYTNNIILSHFINTMILFTYVHQNSHGILHIFDYFILIYSTMSAQKIKNTTSSYVLAIMEGVMQRYIDDGTLSRDISSLGIPTYEHISFYSWDSSLTSTLTILLTGRAPDTTINNIRVHRNVTTQQYCRDVIAPLIMDHCKKVLFVKALSSTDLRFDSAVEAKGGRIMHPNMWDTPISFLEAMQSYGDLHPDIVGSMTAVSKKNVEKIILIFRKTHH